VIIFLRNGDIAKMKKIPTADLEARNTNGAFRWFTSDNCLMGYIPAMSVSEMMSGVIYECILKEGRWFPIRPRFDKETPNAKKTVDATVSCCDAQSTGWMPFSIPKVAVISAPKKDKFSPSKIVKLYLAACKADRVYFDSNDDKRAVVENVFFRVDRNKKHYSLVYPDAHAQFAVYMGKMGATIDDLEGFPLQKDTILKCLRGEFVTSLTVRLAEMCEKGSLELFPQCPSSVLYHPRKERFQFVKPQELNWAFERWQESRSLLILQEEVRRSFGLSANEALDFIFNFKCHSAVFKFVKKNVFLDGRIVMPPIEHPHTFVVEDFLSTVGFARANTIRAHVLNAPGGGGATVGYVRSICHMSGNISYFEGHFFLNDEALYDTFRDYYPTILTHGMSVEEAVQVEEVARHFVNVEETEKQRRYEILKNVIDGIFKSPVSINWAEGMTPWIPQYKFVVLGWDANKPHPPRINE